MDLRSLKFLVKLYFLDRFPFNDKKINLCIFLIYIVSTKSENSTAKTMMLQKASLHPQFIALLRLLA